MAEKEWVYIRLKDQGDDVMPARVTRKAYDMIHAAKGFVIVDDAAAELAGSPATQAEMAEAASGTATRKKG